MEGREGEREGEH